MEVNSRQGISSGASSTGATTGAKATHVELPIHAPRWGMFFCVSGVALAAIILFVMWQVNVVGHGHPISSLEGLGIAVATGLFGRRLRAKGGLDALRSDHRPPVLYLRSFQSDVEDRKVEEGGLSAVSFKDVTHHTWRWWWVGTLPESALTRALGSVGPVLAIGRPGEKLASLGAARIYVSDADWQNTVRSLIEHARLVVVRVGKSTGIRWELKTIKEGIPGDKVALWFPGEADQATRDIAKEDLRVNLPKNILNSFVTFDADWRPKSTTSISAFSSRKTWDSLRRSVPPDGKAQDLRSTLDMLEKFELSATPPPPFRLHPLAWAVFGVWLFLMLLFMLASYVVYSQEGYSWIEAVWRGIGVKVISGWICSLIAFGAAFFFYVRDPSGRFFPSLAFILCLSCYTWFFFL